MNNVENNLEASKINDVSCEKLIKIKPSQGLNESNLMTLPFISLKRKKVGVLDRTWIKDNTEVGLKVVGSMENGCPTIYELDVLLALFRILINNMDNQYTLKDKKVDFPKVIHFTYRKLAKEMGFKNFGSGIKARLEKSLKTLNETTIYSKFAFRDQEVGRYIKQFKGEESCRILKSFKSYSVEERKYNGEKLANPTEIEELQSVEIDDFFYNNLCSNYFKIYDRDKYKLLTKSIGKKLLLILTQWSQGYEKYITMKTLYDYIGIDVYTKEDEYYYNQELKKALDELIKVKFIQDYEFVNGKGVKFIFNVTGRIKSKGLDKYTKDEEVVARLREIGISYEDINKHCKFDTMSYVSALLRYVDYRNSMGKIDELKDYVEKGLPYGRYDVKEYEIEI